MRPDEHGREDVMTEAVSLIERIECRYSENAEPAVLGFNQQRWLFVYFGSDPMYRFDELGRLRRAFVDGMLYRTAESTLAIMERHSSRNQSEPGQKEGSYLLRRDLSLDELKEFHARMLRELQQLNFGLETRNILRQIPAGESMLLEAFRPALKLIMEKGLHEFLAPSIVRR